jgi:hypothetical protein
MCPGDMYSCRSSNLVYLHACQDWEKALSMLLKLRGSPRGDGCVDELGDYILTDGSGREELTY